MGNYYVHECAKGPLSKQMRKTEAAANQLVYCCCACCTLHVDCGDLPELIDIHLESHCIEPKWACTTRTQATGGAATVDSY